MSNLGEILKNLRGKRSLRDVAEITELSHTYISDIEKGYRRGSKKVLHPSPDTLKRLADAYNYPYEELMRIAGYLDEKKYSDIEVFSHKLGKLRREKGMTESDFAGKIGVPTEEYKTYEQETKIPDEALLEKIAGLLEISVDELLSPKTYYEMRDEKFQKDELDIARRLQGFKAEIENSDGLSFDGEPISEEARESLIESMEHLFRQTQRINKKYIPKKHRNE